MAVRRLLVIAILCLGVVLYHSAGLAARPGEIQAKDPATVGGPPPTPVLYQAAVHLCSRISSSKRGPHWCGELAFAPGFNDPPTIAAAARAGMREFANPSLGAGLGNSDIGIDWRWNYQTALWGAHTLSHWWQSALAMRTVVWYAEITHDTAPGIQTILSRTYQRESGRMLGEPPFALAKSNFVNSFMDDTAWWGLAWLEASRYELIYRRDLADATTFLNLAEYDASYVAKQHRPCGGIEWQIGTPPDTITSAEFAALTAELAGYRHTPGPFYDPSKAASWLAQAQSTMSWLQQTRLINLRTGRVQDRLNAACNRLIPGPMTYTQGQVAEAFVQLATATHDHKYFVDAAPFLRFVESKHAGMVSHGILEEPCERDRDGCTASNRYLDMMVFKGILMQAYADYTAATGSTEFVSFIRRQASAVVHNSIRRADGQPGNCNSAQNCQFVFYWGWPLSPVRSPLVTNGTQMSALDALIAVLALPPAEQRQF